MISYIGFFLILLALLNATLLVLSKPIFSKIVPSYQNLIFSTSKIQFPIVFLSFLCLIFAFLSDDFSIRYISSNSNSSLPYFYKISATWAGHEGSMLLWCLVLSFWMFLASIYSKSLDSEFRTKFLSIMGILNIGFLMFLIFTSNPFEQNLSVPIDGKDLNPLLQDFGLIVHPPMLYMGYVGLSVVFSFAITCCLQGEFKPEWAKWIRPWALISWSFLTFGIALGSWWAYYELGWGGWWFWDPVENASFMPWLITTALIHSLIICEQKSIFKNWTILLSIIAFSLSLLGTFLVRSGILISVHSFANDPARGLYILLFLTLVIGGSLIIYIRNTSKIKDDNNFAFFSKESFFLINNILLVTAAFTILLGTIYPLVLDLIGLEKISVGVPYYNIVFLPLMIPLVLLAGYIPILFLSKNQSTRNNIKYFLASFVIILLLTLFSLIFLDSYNLNVLIGIFIFFWISANLLYDLLQKYMQTKKIKVLMSNIGMTFAHIGLAVFVLGATVVENNKIEKELIMNIGEKTQVSGYTFLFSNMNEEIGPNYKSLKAEFKIYKDGELISKLYPEKRLYLSNKMPMTEAGIEPGLAKDLYIVLGNLIDDDKWSVRIYHKPLIRLIWIGALMMVLGGISSVISRRKQLHNSIE
ncbi:MAG: heme lyase CcmF/NrfE family subunit [Pelagibacterales bacterium]|nr:heme lyase CcmF/NrfE family subunit [Pelagibacterales bacterium]|tara:strand:+ start:1234 stop:3156 length:1923 start_codon:yes stop_codon:yes gene_type:complete